MLGSTIVVIRIKRHLVPYKSVRLSQKVTMVMVLLFHHSCRQLRKTISNLSHLLAWITTNTYSCGSTLWSYLFQYIQD